jgi:hypothetical protein
VLRAPGDGQLADELLADERVPKQTIQDAALQAGAWRTVERPKTHAGAHAVGGEDLVIECRRGC